METVPEPEHSSPVLTWILGYFWSLPREVSPRLEWGHARALSSRAVAAVSCFPSRGSRDLWLSLLAYPPGFPTGLSHVPPWCESILGLKVEAVLGKLVSVEWTQISGGIWECGTTLEFLSPFLWTGPPNEMVRNAGNSYRPRRERIPPLELGGGKGATLDVAGLSCFLSSGVGYVGELPELQQGCEGSFGSSRG